jgi:hypothetical protein
MLAPTWSRRGPLALFALAACWAAAPAARADNIDAGLFKHAPAVVDGLHTRGSRNVGVLPFRVQQGAGKPSLRVGKLNALLATRLENALILGEDMDETKPLGVTRGAGAVAEAAEPEATPLTAAGRRKLFAHAYPLAWGKARVKVDVFLTGLLKVDPKAGKSTVVLEAFDAKAPDKVRKVAEFTVPADRALLADLGRRFTLTRRSLRKGVEERELDDKVVQTALREPEPKVVGEDDVEQILDFRVYYNGKPVRRDDAGRVPEPRPGDKVYFVLKSKERVGLVLRVNGVNTLGYEKEPREVADYSMWVLDPGKEYRIEGFYPENGKVLPFKVVAPGAGATGGGVLLSKLGQIDLDLFREAGDSPADAGKDLRLTSLRDAPKAATRAQLTGKLRVAVNRKIRSKGIIVGDLARNVGPIGEVEFNGRWAARLTITYRPRPDAAQGP